MGIGKTSISNGRHSLYFSSAKDSSRMFPYDSQKVRGRRNLDSFELKGTHAVVRYKRVKSRGKNKIWTKFSGMTGSVLFIYLVTRLFLLLL